MAQALLAFFAFYRIGQLAWRQRTRFKIGKISGKRDLNVFLDSNIIKKKGNATLGSEKLIQERKILAENSINYVTRLHGEIRSSDFQSLSSHAIRKHFTLTTLVSSVGRGRKWPVCRWA